MSDLRQRTKTTTMPAPDAVARTPGATKLLYYHNLEEWRKDNHYILSGYVPQTNSFKKCFDSLFYVHNETVNIWSHLVPSLIVLAAIYVYVNDYLVIYPTHLGWEKFNFLQFGIAATCCMGLSSIFHCSKSHSQPVSKFGNQLDYFGIIIMITCSLISIILFAFYDEPVAKYGFLSLFLVLGGICSVLTLDPQFATPTYRPLRSAMFILFGLSGVLPVAAATYIYGLETAIERSNAKYLVGEGFFYIFGAVMYAMRVPERFTHVEVDEETYKKSPTAGKLDIVGNSHQILHVCVVIAAYFHWCALLGCYHYLHQKTLA
ncbi:ADIPOR-like receptor IZH1 [Meyerozyma sp. JA9]|nr:ADIPOR-like receptor IZH1 [Meyerozyma sp. JA9]